MALNMQQVENAFLPSKEITDAKRFSGRKDLILNLYQSAISSGNNIAIIGNRGVGKTSLSRQLGNIAIGENRILENIGLENEPKLDFISVYFACGDSIEDINTLLRKLLTSRDCLGEWIYDIPNGTKEIAKISGGIDVKIAKIGSDVSEESSKAPAISTHDTDVIFTNVVSEISRLGVAKNGILIVIDEFDRIKDPEGFSAFMKSCATNVPTLKFCIVGVAQDLQNLMKEHQSTDRLFAGSVITVPPMEPAELEDIIDRAELSIDRQIRFATGAREYMCSLSQGHPYIIHLLGKYALRQAFIQQKKSVEREDVDWTIEIIAATNADPILEARYKKAVGNSRHRETVLKVFAEYDAIDGEVYTKEAYKKAIDQEVDNPSYYVGNLVTPEYGQEIAKDRDYYYRFRDSLFKAYVKMRPKLLK